ncbi:MAG: hypothetical protein PHH58_13545, partial [Rhodoferax sp.]|nr:hypothetical protein [Rhodoferax sp.]
IEELVNGRAKPKPAGQRQPALTPAKAPRYDAQVFDFLNLLESILWNGLKARMEKHQRLQA